jgi:flagellar basal-body rod modification protein FlgD
MQLDPVTAGPSVTSDTARTRPIRETGLDYDAFLQLLIAQMKNQDPTDPIDSAQYVAQIATFSGVEQAVMTNAKLDALMTSLALSQADGIIGRTIESADGSVSGRVAAVRVVTGGAVALLTDGREVRLGPGVTVAGP